MKIIVGLGNPGPKYETTRHNVGFLAVDRLIERWRAPGPSDKYLAEIYSAERKGEKIALVKPQTFMNLSGKSVGPLFGFHKCKPGDMIVIHDEVDLKPLQLRIKTGGGTGGHNGLKSIDQHLGAGNTGYHRVRIGVGKPGPDRPGMDTADWVLGQFSDDELTAIDKLLDRVADAIEMILDGDVNGAMTKFNRDDSPKASSAKESR
jgi:PTH1 family peptidyl-tRNA hydrolase